MKYYPILLSKAGEFKALEMLNIDVYEETCPVIEVLPDALDRLEATLLNCWGFEDNKVVLDFSSYQDVDVKALKLLFKNLISGGVNAIPCIQENSLPKYCIAVREIIAKYNIGVCIRTSNESGGFNNYNASVNAIMASVGANRANTILLLDLGYVTVHNSNLYSALAISILSAIPNLNQWGAIVVASGSFPENLTHLVPPNIVHRLPRLEWDVWNDINAVAKLRGHVKYGDFGNKNPIYSDVGGYAGSCSIKYTTLNEYVIYRGIRAADHPLGNSQYIVFAERLIRAAEYSGANYSWGDFEINRIAHEVLTNPKKKPGSSTTWVQLTQNHHITLVCRNL